MPSVRASAHAGTGTRNTQPKLCKNFEKIGKTDQFVKKTSFLNFRKKESTTQATWRKEGKKKCRIIRIMSNELVHDHIILCHLPPLLLLPLNRTPRTPILRSDAFLNPPLPLGIPISPPHQPHPQAAMMAGGLGVIAKLYSTRLPAHTHTPNVRNAQYKTVRACRYWQVKRHRAQRAHRYPPRGSLPVPTPPSPTPESKSVLKICVLQKRPIRVLQKPRFLISLVFRPVKSRDRDIRKKHHFPCHFNELD